MNQKAALLLSLVGAAASSWDDYVKAFDKTGEHARLGDDEVAARRAAFERRSNEMARVNEDPASRFKTRPNQYSDWTEEEMRALLTLRKRPAAKAPTTLPFEAGGDPVDWRDKGAVSVPRRTGRAGAAGSTRPRRGGVASPSPRRRVPVAAASLRRRCDSQVTDVKDQGGCGSCWAFSATGAMEGAYFLATGALRPLSEQQLVNCVTADDGCGGGEMDDAFAYVIANAGIDDEDTYAYYGMDMDCWADGANRSVATFSQLHDVTVNSSSQLEAAVRQQPVSIGLCAEGAFMSCLRGADIPQTGRGAAAATTWIFREDESWQRHGCDVDIPW